MRSRWVGEPWRWADPSDPAASAGPRAVPMSRGTDGRDRPVALHRHVAVGGTSFPLPPEINQMIYSLLEGKDAQEGTSCMQMCGTVAQGPGDPATAVNKRWGR